MLRGCDVCQLEERKNHTDALPVGLSKKYPSSGLLQDSRGWQRAASTLCLTQRLSLCCASSKSTVRHSSIARWALLPFARVPETLVVLQVTAPQTSNAQTPTS